ncbi:hypothetical protein [Mycolicibacterium sp. HS_4_1]
MAVISGGLSISQVATIMTWIDPPQKSREQFGLVFDIGGWVERSRLLRPVRPFGE